MIYHVSLAVLVWLLILLQNETLANRCVKFYEECCNRGVSHDNPCDQFDCDFYKQHKDKEYKDGVVARYSDTVMYRFEHEEYRDHLGKRHPQYECMAPNHLLKRVEYDASPDSIASIDILFKPKNVIYDEITHSLRQRGDNTIVRTSLNNLFNLSDYDLGINLKSNEVTFHKSKHKISGPTRTLVVAAPLSPAIPKYEWLMEFLEHKNSSPPWADAHYDKQHNAWGRAYSFLIALSEPYFIKDSGTHELTQANLFQFGLSRFEPEADLAEMFERQRAENVRYVGIAFSIEDNIVEVFTKMKRHEGFWRPEAVYGRTFDKFTPLKVMKPLHSNHTFYSDGPVTLEFKHGDLIKIGILGIELRDEGVSYHFSGKYQNRNSQTTIVGKKYKISRTLPTTPPPDTETQTPRTTYSQDHKMSRNTKYLRITETETSQTTAARPKSCLCKTDSMQKEPNSCDCSEASSNSQPKLERMQSSQACYLKPSEWHLVAPQSFSCLFTYVFLNVARR